DLRNRRRRRPVVGTFLEDEIVHADLDQIAVLHDVLAGDLLAVDADAGEAVQVLDVVVPRLAQQPAVLPRDVLLREPDDVPVVAADGDLVTDDGNDGLVPLIVFDDQLHAHFPMKACTWSQSLVQYGRYFSSHLTALPLSLRYAYPYPRLRYESISVFLSFGDWASAACASFTAPPKSRATSLFDEACASRDALTSRSFGLGPSSRADSAFAATCGRHCVCSASACALPLSKASTLLASAAHASSFPADFNEFALARCLLAYTAFTWSACSCVCWHQYVDSAEQRSKRLRALSPSPAAIAARSALYASSPRASSAAFFRFDAGLLPAFSYISIAATYLRCLKSASPAFTASSPVASSGLAGLRERVKKNAAAPTANTAARMIATLPRLSALRTAEEGARPCAPAISSAVVGFSPPFCAPSSPFSGGGENFSPGAQKRNLRWPSSRTSPGFRLETAYSSPLTRTPLALLLSI